MPLRVLLRGITCTKTRPSRPDLVSTRTTCYVAPSLCTWGRRFPGVERIELEYGQLHQRRDAIAPHGVLLTDSGSEIIIKKFTITNTGANVDISEQTQLEHGPVNGVQGPSEGYVYDQKVELAKSGEGWKIVSVSPLNPGKPYPTTVVDPDTL